MRRTFWMAVGAVAGAVVTRRVSRTLRSYRPAGLADRAAGLAQRRREFTAAVREAAAEREATLRAAVEQDSPRAPGELTGRLTRRRPAVLPLPPEAFASVARPTTVVGPTHPGRPTTVESTEDPDRRPGR